MNDQNQTPLTKHDTSSVIKSIVIIVVIALMGLISLCLFGFGIFMTINPVLYDQIIGVATGNAFTVGEGFLASSFCFFGPAIVLLIACGIVYLLFRRNN